MNKEKLKSANCAKSNQIRGHCMPLIEAILENIANIVWGMPLVIFLIGGGLYLALYAQLKPFSGFFYGFKLLFKPNTDLKAQGQISYLKALCNALAATVGLGNIAGVAVAVTQGGPGALFWMWVAAIIGMNTKFF